MASSKSGLTQQAPLFQHIPVENWSIPSLHIMLALGVGVLNVVLKFSQRNVEAVEDGLPEALQAEEAAREHLVQQRAAHVACVSGERLPRFNHPDRQRVTDTRASTQSGVDTATAALVQQKTVVRGINANRKHWRVENAINKILSGYGIDRQAYHSNTLVGEHVHKLCDRWENIGKDILALMKSPQMQRVPSPPQLDGQIDHLFDVVNVAMSAIGAVSHFLYKHTRFMPDELLQFKQVVRDFGVIWRKDLRLHVPPKLHYLESHAVEQVERLGSVGRYTEQVMESMHAADNKLDRRFSSVRSWVARTSMKTATAERAELPVVQVAIGKLRAPKKRSAQSEESAEAKRQQIEHEKENQRSAACQVIHMHAMEKT